MVTFVTAEDASVDAFLSVSAGSRYQPRLQEYLASVLERGCTKPDWCVLGLEDGAPVARAALWALPGHAVPTDIVLIPGTAADQAGCRRGDSKHRTLPQEAGTAA